MVWFKIHSSHKEVSLESLKIPETVKPEHKKVALPSKIATQTLGTDTGKPSVQQAKTSRSNFAASVKQWWHDVKQWLHSIGKKKNELHEMKEMPPPKMQANVAGLVESKNVTAEGRKAFPRNFSSVVNQLANSLANETNKSASVFLDGIFRTGSDTTLNEKFARALAKGETEKINQLIDDSITNINQLAGFVKISLEFIENNCSEAKEKQIITANNEKVYVPVSSLLSEDKEIAATLKDLKEKVLDPINAQHSAYRQSHADNKIEPYHSLAVATAGKLPRLLEPLGLWPPNQNNPANFTKYF